MSVVTIARRYAEALADVATARNQVDQIDSELRVFAEMMKISPELHHTFANPIVSQSDKQKVLEALVQRTKASQLTANLLRTMLTNYRLQHVAVVYEQFRQEINRRKGLIAAEVTTATTVGDAERVKMSRTLQQLTGSQVEITYKTDPSLIGGVVTRIGSVVYDGSVRTQLQEIKGRLKRGETGV